MLARRAVGQHHRGMFRHDLLSLRLFVAMCEAKSLSRAAEQLNLAVSAASRRVKLLEREAGADLVLRKPHGVEPTSAGLTMLRYGRIVLRLADQFAANMAEHRSGVRGRVRVFGSSSALVQRLASDLARFTKAHPDIKLDLEERPTVETIEAIQRGQADIGVIVRGAATQGLLTYPYTEDRLAVAVPADHPLASRHCVTLETLFNEDLVSLDAGTAIHRLITERARDAGRYLKLRVQVRSFEVMCQMIRHGLGVGILPEDALRPLADALGLRLVRLDEPWANRALEICISAEDPLDAPAARLMAELLGVSDARREDTRSAGFEDLEI
ncbi:LysR family transcriptional regulator [Alsobacter sp. KACC 23698]|uniref:LysR family transcriptional regulator n=1 Tax=Alsobacter sp. KACC 23698 TaxID=3149229 RepID=A0AAU7JF10_9HYPH